MQAALYSNLKETSELLDGIKAQCDRYLAANAIMKRLIGSDVRHKLKGLRFSLTFQVRLIDSVYVSPASVFEAPSVIEEEKFDED